MSAPVTTAERMLFVAPARWDEACFAAPALRALIACGLKVTVLCTETQKAFWQSVGSVELLEATAKSSAREITKQLGGFSAAMVFEAGAAAEACKKASIARRIGPRGEEIDRLLTDAIAIPPNEHRVRLYLEVVEALGIDTKVAAFFAPAAEPLANGPALIVPDSDFGATYEWPLAAWLDALENIAGNYVIGALPGKANSLALQLADLLHAELRALPEWSKVADILTEFPRVITADGSLPHLASHMGATCTVLFGPGDPTWKRPLGKRHTVLHRHVECSPCFLTKCPFDLRCQNELTAADAIRSAVAGA